MNGWLVHVRERAMWKLVDVLFVQTGKYGQVLVPRQQDITKAGMSMIIKDIAGRKKLS